MGKICNTSVFTTTLSRFQLTTDKVSWNEILSNFRCLIMLLDEKNIVIGWLSVQKQCRNGTKDLVGSLTLAGLDLAFPHCSQFPHSSCCMRESIHNNFVPFNLSELFTSHLRSTKRSTYSVNLHRNVKREHMPSGTNNLALYQLVEACTNGTKPI